MFPRSPWRARIHEAHRDVPIVWLAGVRRVGKTTLVRGLEGALYLNCDLPSVSRRLDDPERFLAELTAPLLVLDEVHQLPDPSRLLKIAADEHPALRVVATGSSTLAATDRFRDSLTGRKRTVHLVPVLAEELDTFGVTLETRLLHGGLPDALLAPSPPGDFYAEWMDSFYARDVQALFRVEKRRAFLLLLETLLRNHGGLANQSTLAKVTGLSRPTLQNYLDVLEVTQAITRLRPWFGGGKQELVQQPKIYGFDSGFVAWANGWTELHAADRGLLWESLVLETLSAQPSSRPVQFWRDKQQREIDFVVPSGRGVDAYECKWKEDAFEPAALQVFRKAYPEGKNFLVAPISGPPRTRRFGDLEVEVCHAKDLGRPR